MSVVRSQGSEWWVIVLACCDETKFGPNLISLSPHVSHFIRSINTLSGFNETPAVNYWLDSLRPYAPLEPGRHRLELNWVSAWWPWWAGRLGLPPPPAVPSHHSVVVLLSAGSHTDMRI